MSKRAESIIHSGASTTTGVASTLISSVDIGISKYNFLGIMVIDPYLDGTKLTATLVDPDPADFDGDLLRVDLGATGRANDKISIRNESTSAGQIGISGNKVTHQGIIIGNWAGGTNNGSEPLTILFNANAEVDLEQSIGNAARGQFLDERW